MKDLEAKLAAVPERWRDSTRTRAYAVMDYIAAGDDGALLVDVLCRRIGLHRSAFYTLVRRWKAAGGDPSAIVPWGRQPGSKPRIESKVTEYIDRQIAPALTEDPQRPTEPIAVSVLAAWPSDLAKPGISYVRRRVAHVRSQLEKKTRRRRRDADGDRESAAARSARWPLDAIVIDFSALDVVVWGQEGEPTRPIVAVAIDTATEEPVAVSTLIAAPSPVDVITVLREISVVAAARGALGPPTIVLATSFGRRWSALVEVLAATGATVVATRARKLRFGAAAGQMLGGSLAGYRLAPRLGHRPPEERTTPKDVLTLPNRTLADFDAEVRAYVSSRRDTAVSEERWPAMAVPDTVTWPRLARVDERSIPEV